MSVVSQSKKITDSQIIEIANNNAIEPNYLKAFCEVEGSGIGFSDYTGRILIQFEPFWMKRFIDNDAVKYSTWLNNKISNQTLEYAAFESACKTNKEAAMKSCSIGMMQVMAFHYQKLGFKTVQDIWDFAEISEVNQVELGVWFIRDNPVLYKAVKEKDSSRVAYYYNGAGYLALAKRLGQIPYDKRIDRAYKRFSTKNPVHKTTTTVNIRSGAGINFDKIAAPLRVNTFVNILENKDGWTKVDVVANDLVGWVISKYII